MLKLFRLEPDKGNYVSHAGLALPRCVLVFALALLGVLASASLALPRSCSARWPLLWWPAARLGFAAVP